MLTNDVLQQLHNHKSIRAFQDRPVSDEVVATILSAAFAGPNMQNFQPVTFIEVTDQKLKQAVTDRVGMGYIASAPRFFVVAVDWHKLLIGQSAENQAMIKEKISSYQFLEGGIVSAAIALGRAQVAAESLGLGSVTMAGVMGAFDLYEKELNLPDYVKPVMGFSLGYPDQEPGIKPKLPLTGSYMKGAYDEDQMVAAVTDYDQTMKDYFASRGMDNTWTEHNAKLLAGTKINDGLTAYPNDKELNQH
ncbi:nitroreductase family protein [Leuconostocaceae bacterium ESL0958]|nr:nitroreductase family protein [Leuconostocaceae bacterium ESL0958]